MVGPNPQALRARPRRPLARLCVATRKRLATSEMIRFVVAPDGTLVPDLKAQLPGRGVWVSAQRSAVAAAVRRQLFARALHRELRVDPGLLDQVEALLERAALAALSIAAKAGRVVTGFAKVEAAVQDGSVGALLHAAEASPDGVKKIAAAAQRALGAQAERLPVIRLFASAQLDLALGRANVVHAALLMGRESESVLSRCARLQRFRDDGGEQQQP